MSQKSFKAKEDSGLSATQFKDGSTKSLVFLITSPDLMLHLLRPAQEPQLETI